MVPDTRIRARALAYLRAGAVRVLAALTCPGADRPTFVEARVTGHRSTYLIRLELGEWLSTCRCDGPCPHVAAVRLITGHPGAATPTTSRKDTRP